MNKDLKEIRKQGKSLPGRGTSTHKGPEVGTHLAYLKNSKEVSGVRMKSARRRVVRDEPKKITTSLKGLKAVTD